MRAFFRFVGKECREIVRTWRLPVVAGFVLFFALTGPVLALYTPQLIESLSTQQPGIVIQVPDPTWRDAYLQWTGNLGETIALVVVIAGAGAIAGEVAGGTTSLVLTKPVSRTSFVLAKAVSLYLLVAISVIAGAALTQGMTYATFSEAPGAQLWGPTLVWLGFALVLVALTTSLSAVMPTLAAAGTGIAVYLLGSGLGFLDAMQKRTPVGLMTAVNKLVTGSEPALAWPFGTAVVLVVLLLGFAAFAFNRREL